MFNVFTSVDNVSLALLLGAHTYHSISSFNLLKLFDAREKSTARARIEIVENLDIETSWRCFCS